MAAKRVVPMWVVVDPTYNETQLYHYSEEQRAKSLGAARLKWVVVASDYFVGTVQNPALFDCELFDTEEEALRAIN
ncbi:MAG: hypothetical protein ACI35P_16050 [Bacillus sp. (in: firmicutes)]